MWCFLGVSSISDDLRVRLLERLVEKLGLRGVAEALGVTKQYVSMMINGRKRIPDHYVEKAIEILGDDVREILRARDLLRICGAIDQNGFLNRVFIMEILAEASRDEVLKKMILEFSVKHFREDLRKILGMIPADIEFRWDQGFEEFLRERKKRMKIKSEDTMRYYRNLFKKHLEGKVLSQDLIDYVINYPVKWLRNVFRHYIQYLYYTRRISPETYGWIMEIVPSRSYKMDVRPYPINIEDLRRTMDFLRERHRKYYVVYRAMLEGG
jgi:transcriptional regulator with XRE-family HTH domain